MMETIKFKFWLGHTSKMTYPHILSEVSNVIPEFTTDIIPLQYTGVKDKNRVEIYQGDIVKLYRHDDILHKHVPSKVWKDGKYEDDIKQVKFVMGSFVLWSDLIKDYRNFSNLARPGESMEVLGNIYENPNLIQP